MPIEIQTLAGSFSGSTVSTAQWREITCKLEDATIQPECEVCRRYSKLGGASLQDLLAAANSACRQCLLVCLVLQHFNSMWEEQPSEMLCQGYSHKDRISKPSDCYGGTAAFYIDAPSDQGPFPGPGNGSHALSSYWGPMLRHSSDIDRDPSSEATFEKIGAWLSTCVKEHTTCTSQPASLPTRVIDVGDF
ncbi:hypothetical protein DL98DRAFT_582920 [Cadophora sp. DSE1049]|nr:hypothetical protein DL98DRAFT_582920 [Cadophora sp. DSE1049]